MKELITSKEFTEARRKITAWNERLEKADKITAMGIKKEKTVFFEHMRKSRPDLYAAFQMDDKILSEVIFKKVTGEEIVIDIPPLPRKTSSAQLR